MMIIEYNIDKYIWENSKVLVMRNWAGLCELLGTAERMYGTVKSWETFGHWNWMPTKYPSAEGQQARR